MSNVCLYRYKTVLYRLASDSEPPATVYLFELQLTPVIDVKLFMVPPGRFIRHAKCLVYKAWDEKDIMCLFVSSQT